jgi:hypothetical protein
MTPPKCINPDLFLAGLPIEIAPGKVRDIFEATHIPTAYTQIVRCKGGEMMQRAVAFIRLADSTDTERAIEQLNGTLIDGHEIQSDQVHRADQPQSDRAEVP